MSRKARRAQSRATGISLCMIVRNEERFLADALTSVAGVVDEICIVDTGSTDATIAIAESYGARIERIAWADDFAAARNAALGMATRPWILVLDADERLAPGSRETVRALAAEPPDGRGRWIWCRNFNDAAREISGSTNAIVRIFPNDPAIRYRGRLHEFVSRDGSATNLPSTRTSIEILHYGYQPDVMAERHKGERNLRMSAAALAADPDDPTLLYNHGMSALLARQPDVARAALERVVALTAATPRGYRPQALNILGGMYLEDGRASDALRLAELCIAIVPTLPDAHLLRGRALAALGRRHEARDAFGTAISRGHQPADHFIVDDEVAMWKAHNELAGTLMIEKRYADARRWLELALRNRPAERTLIANRARCCEELGDLAEALAAYRALFDGYRDQDAAVQYVNFVFRHGSPDVCLQAVEDVLPAADQEYTGVFLASAAAVMARAGRRDEAGRLLGRVLGARPDRAAAEALVRALAAHYDTPALLDLLAGAEPVPSGS